MLGRLGEKAEGRFVAATVMATTACGGELLLRTRRKEGGL
jgi:hypothetical protein